MDNKLGETLSGFSGALEGFREALAICPPVESKVFQGTESWQRLLTYKLLPHLEGNGCLVVAVAGGTNTGKSTIFNLLLQANLSPVRATAAATAHSVMAGHPLRVKQCLAGKLMPEFAPLPLEDPEAVLQHHETPNILYTVVSDLLEEEGVLLDIPDVDSIETEHWEVAETIQAAGDVIIAVLTGEKYKDERVVTFFRRALAAGRKVIPLMNKVNPNDNFSVARAQLAEFQQDVGLAPTPAFVLPHDFEVEKRLDHPISSLEKGPDLRDYLQELDVSAIKRRVYKDTVLRFCGEVEDFLDQSDSIAQGLQNILREYDTQIERTAQQYDPEPGADVGRMIHDYLKGKRGWLVRGLGQVGNLLWKPVDKVRGMITGAVSDRMRLDRKEIAKQAEALQESQRKRLETLTRNTLKDALQRAWNLPEPAAQLLRPSLEALDIEAVVQTVIAKVLQETDCSETFQKHAQRTLDAWWKDHHVGRMTLMNLDALLMIAPTAVAVPLSFYMGGVGAPEVIAATSPLAGSFFARIIEGQFADKWVDLLAPWRKEQQQRLRDALIEAIILPGLAPLYKALDAFEGEAYAKMRKEVQACRRHCKLS